MNAVVFDKLVHLRALGVVFIGVALMHSIFPRRFEWKRELASLSLINQELMKVHTFFVALTVFLIGVVCVVDAADLAQTRLGQHVCLGFAVFWGVRLYAQHFVYSASLWRGRVLETFAHVAFTALWLWATTVFAWVGSASI